MTTLREYIDRQHPFQVPIEVSQLMAGMKKAYVMNGRVYVTPAMMALAKGASHGELVHLLGHIELVNLGTFDPLAMDYLPMTTEG